MLGIRKTVVGLVVALLAGVVGACAEEPNPFDAAPSNLDFSRYDALLEQFVAQEGLAGATSAVVHRDLGVVHVQGYGSFESNRLSLLASSSKIISVGVLMRLADQGLINVDAPIGTYLGAAFGDGGDDKENLTVAQLVSNSSGLVGLIDDPAFAPYICQYVAAGVLQDCARNIYTTMDDTAERVPADTQFRYGGGQWQLAGGIAEVVSGKGWAQLVQETYAPCNVPSLGYANQFQMYATDYPADFNQDPNVLKGQGNPSIEGGGYIRVGEYANLLLMHLRGGTCQGTQVLSPGAVARMQQDRVAAYGSMTISPNLQGYGMGWWIDRDEPGVVVDGGAYGATPWLDNTRGYGAIIIFEASGGVGPRAYAMVKPELDAIFSAP